MKPETFMRYCAVLFFSSCGLLSVARPADAQATHPVQPTNDVNQAYLREHYTKYEYKIPMRDGVKLFTAVYEPKDQSQPYPILMTRTPYGLKPYGEDLYPEPTGVLQQYAKEGFIFVMQDVRGRYASEGQFIHVRPHRPAASGPNGTDESTDAYDTIDWLVKNLPNNSGKVGMIGISYPGFYTAAGMIDSHPALKCASPQAPICDWFAGDDFHHNGAFYLPHAFGFLSGFGQKLEDPTRESPKKFDYKTPDGYEFYLALGPLANADKLFFRNKIEFWDDLMEHGTDDEFWQSRDMRPQLKNVKAAVMTVGGWFDAEDLFGTLSTYRAVEKNNPGAFNMLVMGPWFHGGWSSDAGDHLGNINFGARTSDFYRERIELPFLKHFLKDDSKIDLPKASVFETGTNRWRRYDAWPPKNSRERALYFHAGGKLSFDPPPPNGEAQFDEYISDPAKPVPYIPNIAIGMTREHMVDDQRFAASRPDVLVYQSDVLQEDLIIAGPIEAKIKVSTSGTDSDWIVKLIDVYPGDYPTLDPSGTMMGGYQQLVRGEAMRGKFRESLADPKPFEPGKITPIEYVLPDVNHAFRRGHRIMVQVQSSWFPLIDRNPQKFCDIYHAKPEDFQKAIERVYHSSDAPSSVLVRSVN